MTPCQLVLASGINSNKSGLDNDGIDRHFGNALGHYYVLNLMYPLLQKTSRKPDVRKGSVRIVFESSEMHSAAPGSETARYEGAACTLAGRRSSQRERRSSVPWSSTGGPSSP